MIVEHKLPEFLFLDGSEHSETTTGRFLFMHVRTATVFEIFGDDQVFLLKPDTQKFKFTYKNMFGVTEKLTLAVHFTFSDDLDPVFEKAKNWYCAYCDWEDKNIADDMIKNQ